MSRVESPGRVRKRLLLGVGSGRCGTRSLASLLDAQKGTFVTHEFWDSRSATRLMRPLPWKKDLSALDRALTLLQSYPDQYVGDVASFWLPYLEQILSDPNLDVRVLALHRERTQVVESFLKKTPTANHWMEHPGKRSSLWDDSFPKYAVNSKKEAIERYWDEYYSWLDRLVIDQPTRVRVWDMGAGLNTVRGVSEILEFAGFSEFNVNAGGVRDNASPGLVGKAKRQAVRRLRDHLARGRSGES